MKVSVLIPVYGVERYIEECARSLMEQTYGDIEYIFVDDCTPDDSINRLRSFENKEPWIFSKYKNQKKHIVTHDKKYRLLESMNNTSM